jgi:hypothetical protein
MGSSRSAPTSETIYEPQSPLVTVPVYSKGAMERLGGYTNLARDLYNQSSQDLFGVANVNRPEESKYTFTPVTTDYSKQFVPSDESLLADAAVREKEEQKQQKKDKRQKEKEEAKELERNSYLNAVNQSSRSQGYNRRLNG